MITILLRNSLFILVNKLTSELKQQVEFVSSFSSHNIFIRSIKSATRVKSKTFAIDLYWSQIDFISVSKISKLWNAFWVGLFDLIDSKCGRHILRISSTSICADTWLEFAREGVEVKFNWEPFKFILIKETFIRQKN